MALFTEDRVKEITTTTGTGDITVSGAVTAFRTFAAAGMVTNDTAYMLIEAVDANGVPTGEWETGLYTKTGASTIARTEVKASSAGGTTKVNFGAGTKHISVELTSAHIKTFTSNPTSPSVLTPFGRSETYGALTFQDEFDAASLDTTKWNTAIWYETPSSTINFDLNASKLRIWPQKTPGGAYVNRTIDTDGKYYQTYGYFEMYAKLCNGYGTWPAFWLLNHDGSDRQELDIMEAYPGGENAGNGGWSNSSDQPTNYAGNAWGHGGIQNGDHLGERKMNQDGGFAFQRLDNSWHRYGLRWDSAGLQFTFDGLNVGSKIITSVPTSRAYIILDLWFGGASGNPLSRPAGVPEVTNGSGNAFEIDYVRAWAL